MDGFVISATDSSAEFEFPSPERVVARAHQLRRPQPGVCVFWDLYQQYRIENTSGAVARLSEAVAQDEAAIKTALRLDDKVERLALICCAMFELMQETQNIPEERLKAKILEIDMRDGQADGRMRPRPQKCPKCEAMMSPQFGRCLFCGHQDGGVSAFA